VAAAAREVRTRPQSGEYVTFTDVVAADMRKRGDPAYEAFASSFPLLAGYYLEGEGCKGPEDNGGCWSG